MLGLLSDLTPSKPATPATASSGKSKGSARGGASSATLVTVSSKKPGTQGSGSAAQPTSAPVSVAASLWDSDNDEDDDDSGDENEADGDESVASSSVQSSLFDSPDRLLALVDDGDDDLDGSMTSSMAGGDNASVDEDSVISSLVSSQVTDPTGASLVRGPSAKSSAAAPSTPTRKPAPRSGTAKSGSGAPAGGSGGKPRRTMTANSTSSTASSTKRPTSAELTQADIELERLLLRTREGSSRGRRSVGTAGSGLGAVTGPGSKPSTAYRASTSQGGGVLGLGLEGVIDAEDTAGWWMGEDGEDVGAEDDVSDIEELEGSEDEEEEE